MVLENKIEKENTCPKPADSFLQGWRTAEDIQLHIYP